MARFGRILQRAEAGLRVSSHRRARLLEEVAVDLEGAYGAYRGRGLGEEEAARRAEELLGLSDEAVAALGRLHASPYARLLDRFSEEGRHRFERALLGALLVVSLALAIRGILAAGGPRLDVPAVWVVLVLGAAAASLLAADRLADLRGAGPSGAGTVDALVALGSAVIVAGGIGAAAELWRFRVPDPAAGSAVAFDAVAPDLAVTSVTVAAALGDAARMLALAVVVGLLVFAGAFRVGTRRRSAARQRARIPGLEIPSTEEDAR